MASYLPPTLHNGVVNTTFNPDDFSAFSSLYVNFPQAQGTVTFPNAIVSGLLTTGTLSATNGTIDNIQIRRPFPLQNNQAIGYNSLQNILSSGYDNFVFGSNTANGITSGNNNTIVGNAGFTASNCSNTTSIGANNGTALTSGTSNTFIGKEVMPFLTTGSYNTAIGPYPDSSGIYTGYGLTTGSNNTFVGGKTNTTLSSASNSTAVGYGATITANNQVVLGSNTETVVIPNQIQFNYTTLPTFSSTSIGYNTTFALATTAFILGSATAGTTTTNLPVGIYQVSAQYQFNQQNGSTNRLQVTLDAVSGITNLVPIQWSMMSTTSGGDYFYFTIGGTIKVTNASNSVRTSFFAGGGTGASLSAGTLGVVRIA